MATSILYPIMGGQDMAGVHGKVWAWAGPAPQSPHFYRQGLGWPGPQTFTFIDRTQPSPAPNPSFLLANPSLLLSQLGITYKGGALTIRTRQDASLTLALEIIAKRVTRVFYLGGCRLPLKVGCCRSLRKPGWNS